MNKELKVVSYVCDLKMEDLGIVLPCYGSIEEPLFWWKDVRDLANLKSNDSSNFLKGIDLEKDECFQVILGDSPDKNRHGGIRKNTKITMLSKIGLLKTMSQKTAFNNDMIFSIAKNILTKDEISNLTLANINCLKDNYRDEIEFFKQLKEELDWWKEDYIHSYCNGELKIYSHLITEAEQSYKSDVIYCEDIKLELQKSVCNGKYRIDCYIPEFKIAIEYDEKFHMYQIDEDKEREKEISNYIMKEYLNELFKDKLEDIKKIGYDNIVDYANENTDSEYNPNTYIEFIRVKQGDERRMLQFIKNRLMYKYL